MALLDALFRRNLGLPADAPEDPATARLAAEARDWYAGHGAPWSSTALVRIESIDGPRIALAGGQRWTSEVLARSFRQAGAGTVAVIGASAGVDVDIEIDARWRAGRPDEAVFLGALAASVAESLRDEAEAQLRSTFERDGLRVLQRWSPGYPGWDLSDQASVLAALEDTGPIRVLPSGALAPARSTLAACGIGMACSPEPATGAVRQPAATATNRFPDRALAKWARERLTIERGARGEVSARFRFDGTTCASLGVPIAMLYDLELAPDASGALRISRLACEPAPGRDGYRAMCAFHADPEGFPARMKEAPPLAGCTLDEALAMEEPLASSGCLCDASHRAHKWRIALETLHHRLKSALLNELLDSAGCTAAMHCRSDSSYSPHTSSSSLLASRPFARPRSDGFHSETRSKEDPNHGK